MKFKPLHTGACIAMTLISRGYSPNCAASDSEKDWQLFIQNIDLLLNNEQEILNRANYFFCNLSFAWCSWPYISGDGQLYLGYLLLGWRTNQLMENCPTCNGKALITSFGGSPLTGSNGWTGICLTCHQKQKGEQSAAFRQWMHFVLKLRQSFPDKVCEQQEYLGQEFSWGGSGLNPIMKKRIVWKPVANAVTLAVLIEELKTNNIRKDRPVNVHLLKREFELKLSMSLQKDSVHIRL